MNFGMIDHNFEEVEVDNDADAGGTQIKQRVYVKRWISTLCCTKNFYASIAYDYAEYDNPDEVKCEASYSSVAGPLVLVNP